MPVLTIPKVLREKIGEEGVDELISIINEVEKEARKDSLALAEERFERRLSEEVAKVNNKITEETGKLRIEIEKTKSEILKWMFIFWIGQIGVLSGIIFAMFRLYVK